VWGKAEVQRCCGREWEASASEVREKVEGGKHRSKVISIMLSGLS